MSSDTLILDYLNLHLYTVNDVLCFAKASYVRVELDSETIWPSFPMIKYYLLLVLAVISLFLSKPLRKSPIIELVYYISFCRL